jgi:translation initiation factor IF-2
MPSARAPPPAPRPRAPRACATCKQAWGGLTALESNGCFVGSGGRCRRWATWAGRHQGTESPAAMASSPSAAEAGKPPSSDRAVGFAPGTTEDKPKRQMSSGRSFKLTASPRCARGRAAGGREGACCRGPTAVAGSNLHVHAHVTRPRIGGNATRSSRPRPRGAVRPGPAARRPGWPHARHPRPAARAPSPRAARVRRTHGQAWGVLQRWKAMVGSWAAAGGAGGGRPGRGFARQWGHPAAAGPGCAACSGGGGSSPRLRGQRGPRGRRGRPRAGRSGGDSRRTWVKHRGGPRGGGEPCACAGGRLLRARRCARGAGAA